MIDAEILADYIAENDMEFQYAIEHQDRKELESLIEKILDYPCAECIEAGGCPIREDCPNEGKKKSKSDMIVEQLEELRKECEDPLQEYNPNYFIDKAIEIVKGGGVDGN